MFLACSSNRFSFYFTWYDVTLLYFSWVTNLYLKKCCCYSKTIELRSIAQLLLVVVSWQQIERQFDLNNFYNFFVCQKTLYFIFFVVVSIIISNSRYGWVWFWLAILNVNVWLCVVLALTALRSRQRVPGPTKKGCSGKKIIHQFLKLGPRCSGLE